MSESLAGGDGPDTLPNQIEGATGPSHLGTGAERNLISCQIANALTDLLEPVPV
jgi:hypothetical protein